MSSFFQHGSTTEEGQLALLHLSRGQQLPVILSSVAVTQQDEGYDEGVVTNTKFGSFPHSTLIGVPWGSQVLASQVDTGSRGRREPSQGKKRKSTAISTDSPADSSEAPAYKDAQTASSGFIHVLPPTPESWTTGLPHRTQVVYTPDYSYILHRLRARPGTKLIEAGSGSGSFTHAAARAVHNGLIPNRDEGADIKNLPSGQPSGKVFSFEFHLERHQKVLQEMHDHGLNNVVTATHRDVYKDGFLLKSKEDGSYQSPSADAVFLDLPAPWEALPHLTRLTQDGKPSALSSSMTASICTFSPCIEQAQKTISALRKFGWLEIEMVEMQHRRIDVRREYTGFKYDGMRSVNSMAVDVNEAVSKLREVEQRTRDYHTQASQPPNKNKQQMEQNRQQDAAKVLYKEGRLTHRSEPELKTHTSYLVFAILPREWSDEDESEARSSLTTIIEAAPIVAKSQRQLKKEAKQRKKQVLDGGADHGKQVTRKEKDLSGDQD